MIEDYGGTSIRPPLVKSNGTPFRERRASARVAKRLTRNRRCAFWRGFPRWRQSPSPHQASMPPGFPCSVPACAGSLGHWRLWT